MGASNYIKPLTAVELARLITANCEDYHQGRITYEAWSAEQMRLWGIAAQNVVASQVLRLVAPTCQAGL